MARKIIHEIHMITRLKEVTYRAMTTTTLMISSVVISKRINKGALETEITRVGVVF